MSGLWSENTKGKECNYVGDVLVSVVEIEEVVGAGELVGVFLRALCGSARGIHTRQAMPTAAQANAARPSPHAQRRFENHRMITRSSHILALCYH